MTSFTFLQEKLCAFQKEQNRALMPSLPTASSLREKAMVVVAKNYELLCYGCKARHQMNRLDGRVVFCKTFRVSKNVEIEFVKICKSYFRLLMSDGEDYKKVAGPFFDLPSSLLEDIIKVI